jgi:hypothetical protein
MSDRSIKAVSFQASGIFAGAINTAAMDVSAYREINVYVNITVAGTTLDLKLQTSDDNVTFYDLLTVPQITAAGQFLAVQDGGLGKFLRLSNNAVGNWTGAITGILKT